MTALVDQELRERASSRSNELDTALENATFSTASPESTAGKSGGRTKRRESIAKRHKERLTQYRELENDVLDLANLLPAGTEDYEVRQLLRFLLELRSAIDADTSANDEGGWINLAIAKMRDVNRRMQRRLSHTMLEDPRQAADYVLEQLAPVPVTDQAELLGVSTKTLGAWKRGGPVRQNGDRVRLVAKLISYLASSMTPTGIVMWFRSPAERLGGRSPLKMLKADEARAWEELVGFARGSRAQLAE